MAVELARAHIACDSGTCPDSEPRVSECSQQFSHTVARHRTEDDPQNLNHNCSPKGQ